MRLVTYEVEPRHGPTRRLGVLNGDRVIDLISAYALYLYEVEREGRAYEVAEARITRDMTLFIAGGEGTLRAAQAALQHIQSCIDSGSKAIGVRREPLVLPLERVRLRAPLQPVSLWDTSSFEGHIKNLFQRLGRQVPDRWYQAPTYYRSSHTNVIGPDEPIVWPSYTETLDYELELAIVIGKGGKNISAAEARKHIFGVTIYNDMSCRDVQHEEMQLGVGPVRSKSFDTGNVIGPCIVTLDEIPDLYNLRMAVRVNGQLWSEGSTRDMYHRFEEIIRYMSQDMELFPGEVIGSGTVSSGSGMDLDRWLLPGDIIELEVERIGILRNPIERNGSANPCSF